MLRTAIATIALFSGRQTHCDQFLWHEISAAPLFALDVEGKPLAAEAAVWRRRKIDNSGWEYRQVPESYDDWLQRVGW